MGHFLLLFFTSGGVGGIAHGYSVLARDIPCVDDGCLPTYLTHLPSDLDAQTRGKDTAPGKGRESMALSLYSCVTLPRDIMTSRAD